MGSSDGQLQKVANYTIATGLGLWFQVLSAKPVPREAMPAPKYVLLRPHGRF